MFSESSLRVKAENEAGNEVWSSFFMSCTAVGGGKGECGDGERDMDVEYPVDDGGDGELPVEVAAEGCGDNDPPSCSLVALRLGIGRLLFRTSLAELESGWDN